MTRRWPEVELGTIAVRLQDGPFGSNLKSSHYVEEGVRVVRLQNVGSGYFDDSNQAFIDRDHFKRLRKHECVPGDVLVATLGDPIVRAAVLPPTIPVALNKADCVQLRCHPDRAVPEYVSHYLNSPRALGHAEARSHGQTRPRVNLSQLRTMPIPLPPIEEQLRIAAVLDAADALRAKRRQAIAKFGTLTQSIFIDMFGDQAREVSTLEEVAFTRAGFTWRSSGFVKESRGLPVIRIQNVGQDGAAFVYWPGDFDQKFLVESGDILMSLSGSFRVAAWGGPPALLNQRILRIRPRPDTERVWLLAALTQRMERVAAMGRDAVIRNVSISDVRLLELPSVSPFAQTVFAKKVQIVNRAAHHSGASLSCLDTLFASLRQRAFRGEL